MLAQEADAHRSELEVAIDRWSHREEVMNTDLPGIRIHSYTQSTLVQNFVQSVVNDPAHSKQLFDAYCASGACLVDFGCFRHKSLPVLSLVPEIDPRSAYDLALAGLEGLPHRADTCE